MRGVRGVVNMGCIMRMCIDYATATLEEEAGALPFAFFVLPQPNR